MKPYTIIPILFLADCNSMYIKPGTLDPTATFYSTAGGFSMKRSIKEHLEERGYNVFIGKQTTSRTVGSNDNGTIDLSEYKMENVRYVINVNERQETTYGPKLLFLEIPFWCIFNGWWWWDFNVSIGDQQTGEEIFTWRGLGCASSSMRKLDAALDKLEMKEPSEFKPWTKRIKENKPG
jgi:hypothetical protein